MIMAMIIHDDTEVLITRLVKQVLTSDKLGGGGGGMTENVEFQFDMTSGSKYDYPYRQK